LILVNVAFSPVPTTVKSTQLPETVMMNGDTSRFLGSVRPRVLLFPASLRRESYQRRLVGYVAAHLTDGCEIDVLEASAVDLPLFNQDLEQSQSILDAVRALHRRFDRADGMIVASPEYNGHVSPYLKNTVDWISRLSRIDAQYAASHPLSGRPLLLCSASTGWTGGVVGLQDARSIFANLGNLVVADQICVADSVQWVCGNAFKFEPAFTTHIASVLADFVSLVMQLQVPRSNMVPPIDRCIANNTTHEYI
jgi:chromate reductase, NAD(P)H dehydrogenase (quinone)